MNLKISRILVPLDFSAHSELALQYAKALAMRFRASVELLHVVEDPITTVALGSETVIPDLPELRQELMTVAERRLAEYHDAGTHPLLPIRTTVRMGRTARTITDYAKEAGSDLIVMGTHGRTGVVHLFTGSVAEHVLRHAPCPVLTLRAPACARQLPKEHARATAA